MNAAISRGYTPACILDSPSGFIGGTIADNHNLLYYVLMLFICRGGVLEGGACLRGGLSELSEGGAGRRGGLFELLDGGASLRGPLSCLLDLAAC